MVKVSIIMPSLNVGQYITECIESAVKQSLEDIEIICVDAGSTDGTWEILQLYQKKDARVRIIKSDVMSYGAQVNMGIAASRGQYIAILETDDYMATNGLSEMTNIDYYNYLNQTIGSLDPITDMASIDVYNQQLMMLDYCNYNNLDFGTAFYDNCFDL